jgi:hypothetical protein
MTAMNRRALLTGTAATALTAALPAAPKSYLQRMVDLYGEPRPVDARTIVSIDPAFTADSTTVTLARVVDGYLKILRAGDIAQGKTIVFDPFTGIVGDEVASIESR